MSDLHKELLDLLNELPATNDYSAKDRYADFRQIFMGSDQGKRVYRELMAWGKMFNTSVSGSPIDTHKVIFNEGHRNFAIKLMAAVNIEPPERPTKATKSRS